MQQEKYDVVIVGAGPAGLTAAIYTSRRGLKSIVLEEAAVGGRASYAHIVENYPGFPEGISGIDLIKRFVSQAERFGTVIKTGEGVIDIDVKQRDKVARTPLGEYVAKAIIITTGLRQKKLSVPGEDKLLGRGVSYCATCDGFFFRNRKVAVLGGGYEAASDIIYLSTLTNKITWIPNTEKLTIEEAYMKKLNEAGVSPVVDSKIIEVFGDGRVQGIKVRKNDGSVENREVDGLFIAIGTVPTVDILKQAGLTADAKGYISVNDEMESNVSGVYAAGDCTGKSHQIVVAVGQGAVAGINASDYVKMKS